MAKMHAGGFRWVLGLALWAGLLTPTMSVWAANSAVSSQPLSDTAPAPIATLPLEKQLWGGQAWADVNPEEVASLLNSLPAESHNAWVHDATHQLLLTAPPTSTESLLPITKLRVDRLVQLGYFHDAAGLLAALPARSQSTPLTLRRRLLDLLTTPKDGEIAKAFCSEVEKSQGTLAGDLPNWLPSAAVWCLWQKGDQAAAEVGLNVLQEQLDLAATPLKKDDGAAKSPEPLPPATTLKLLNSVVTNTPLELAGLSSATYTPNDFDLWLWAHANLITGSAAGQTTPNTLAATAPAIVKEMLLDNPHLTPALRAEWGGELALRGYVDNSWLQNIRDQVPETTSPDPQKLFAEWPAPNHHQQWLGYGLRLTPSLRDLATVDQPAGLAQQVVALALYRGDIELARRWLRVAENRDPLHELLFSWLTESQGNEVLGNRLIQRLAAQPNTANLSYAVQLALMQTGDDSDKPSRSTEQWMREWRQQLTTLQAPPAADAHGSLAALDWLSLSSPADGWWAENSTQKSRAARLIPIIRVLNTPTEGRPVPAYGWALVIKQLDVLNQTMPDTVPTLTLPILPAVQAIVWSAQSEGQKLDAPSKSPAKSLEKAGGEKAAGRAAAPKPASPKPSPPKTAKPASEKP
jgi:hypothetical protein